MYPTFKCAKCKKIHVGESYEFFIEVCLDEEILPWNIKRDIRGVLCRDCFESYKTWFDGLTQEQYSKIQEELKKYLCN